MNIEVISESDIPANIGRGKYIRALSDLGPGEALKISAESSASGILIRNALGRTCQTIFPGQFKVSKSGLNIFVSRVKVV